VSTRLLQAALLLAGAAAIVLLLGLFETGVALAACVAIWLATLLAAPAARGPDGGWWRLLAFGALAAAAGVGLAALDEGVGGLGIVLGGVAVLVASAVGMPARGR
jgi:hypothetical protein